MAEYLMVRIAIALFALIPFPLLYLLSDVLALLMIIFGYRKKVICKNLKSSFPEKSKPELKKIARKFYFNLSDIMLESLKGYTLSAKQFKKRYKVKNPEVDIKYYDNGQNVIYVGGHLGNWEWGTQATPFILKHKVVILYKPLKNKRIDAFIKKKRERFGVKMVSIKLTRRGFDITDKPYCVIMVSDQNPSNVEKAIRVNFLNQPTYVLHGTELYAKLFNFPVIFFKTRRKKRGYYEIELIPVCDNPRQTAKGELTQKFMSELEKAVKERPELWLWSHKRWKHNWEY